MAIDPNNLAGTAHITFDDEFNALSLWSPSSPGGTWATTFWYQDPNGNGATLAANGEQEWYINANYGPTASVQPWSVADGILTLTAAPASSAISPLINGYAYTSGEVNTYHSFSQTYGYFEMKAELPYGQGFWPAFWLMPENGAWPPELDVMEVLGNNTSRLYNTVHTLQTGSHTSAGDNGVTVAEMSTGYHTFGVDWEPDTITFYFDGRVVFQTATPSDMNSPMYMIANLADGGYWPGAADGQTGQMKIDYIRAYASGAGAGAPETTNTTSTSTGQSYNSDNNGDHWTGTTGNDIFYLGRGGDVVTGNGGNDIFAFTAVPWGAGTITDFHPGDVLDLNGLLADAHYAGSNPIADGYLKITSDSAGDAQVWANYNQSANNNWWLVDTLKGVAASSLSLSHGVIAEGGAWSTAGQSYAYNGSSDMFWQNTVNGLTSAWELNGSAASGVSLPNASGWKVMDTGHFGNGAANGDILLRNTTTGMVDIWTHNGDQLSGHDVAQATLDWNVMGTADFNGDGMSDILWRNEQNGYVSVWQMNGSNVTTTYNPGVVGLQWHVIGAGDYVGDGKAEVLWRDQGTGEVNLWTIDGPGAGQTHGQTVANLPLEWRAVGQGDFNGDGRQDVLWHDNATGQVVIWEMNGPQVLASQAVANVGPQWKVAAVVDANSDGKADIVWRDSNNGQTVLWDMDGSNVTHAAVLGTIDNTWQAINHHYDWI